jgi:MFS family permease
MTGISEERVIRLRWLVLVLMGLTVFGVYFAYDSVVPIQQFIEDDMGVTRAQYGLLFSYYSVPNLIMVLIGGILLDRFGIRKAGLSFAALAVVGVLLTAIGSMTAFPLMLWGRLLYGIGAESASIVMIKVLSKWFKGKEFAFAMGLYIMIVRLGNFASLNLGAPLQEWSGSWRFVLWVAVVTMVLSFIAFFVYARLDRAKEQFFVQRGDVEQSERIVLRDIFAFRRSYWFVNILCVTFYSGVLPFVAFSNSFLQTKFGFTATQAGFYGSLIFVATMLCTPLFGLFVDKFGRRATIMITGSFLIVPAYLTLGLTDLHPSLPIILIGIAFSLVPAALWASVPILVEPKRLGTGFGLITLVQNLGLTVVPWAAGRLTDLAGGDYTNSMLMFAALGVVGFIFSVGLILSEKLGEPTGIELPTRLAQANADGS